MKRIIPLLSCEAWGSSPSFKFPSPRFSSSESSVTLSLSLDGVVFCSTGKFFLSWVWVCLLDAFDIDLSEINEK